jgi:hypothetical protein
VLRSLECCELGIRADLARHPLHPQALVEQSEVAVHVGTVWTVEEAEGADAVLDRDDDDLAG